MLLPMPDASPAPERRANLVLLGWLLGLVAAIAALTLAGRGALAAPSIMDPAAWGPWAQGRDALTIAFTLLRLLTLALAWYLLGATLVGGVARVARWRRLVAVADVLTVPAVRRLLQSALGVGLATAALSVGSADATPPRPMPTAATLTMAAEADPAHVVMTPVSDKAETMTPVAELPVPPPAQAQWTVGSGDHFWSIAEQVLTDVWGRVPTDAEVVAYWNQLITANRDRLADPANPDLIYPGQTFRVPDPPRRP